MIYVLFYVINMNVIYTAQQVSKQVTTPLIKAMGIVVVEEGEVAIVVEVVVLASPKLSVTCSLTGNVPRPRPMICAEVSVGRAPERAMLPATVH